MLRDALTTRQTNMSDDWRTLETLGLLGASQVRQKHYAEAEPVLQQAYEKMQARGNKLPVEARHVVTEIVEQLSQLNDALGRKDKAQAWRKRLDELKKP
jgi:hypothetical protein